MIKRLFDSKYKAILIFKKKFHFTIYTLKTAQTNFNSNTIPTTYSKMFYSIFHENILKNWSTVKTASLTKHLTLLPFLPLALLR